MSYGVPGIWTAYAILSLSAAQTTNFALNQRVEFNTLTFVGGLPTSLLSITTGSGQANGALTINAGRFATVTSLNVTGGTAQSRALAWTTTAGVVIGSESGNGQFGTRLLNNTASAVCGSAPVPFLVDATGAAITMEYRFRTVVSGTPTSLLATCYLFPLMRIS